jgi:hypothetical protein
MLADLGRARIVITNYHAFKRRERMELSKGGRLLLQGRGGAALDTLETEGQMLQRVIPELMGLKNILAINDEAHHCYREKPGAAAEDDLKGDDRKEAEKNKEAARLWISGLEAVNRTLGLACAFNYDAHASEFAKLGRIPVLKARMNADLHMAADLKNTGKGNLFVIFGEPDIEGSTLFPRTV